MCPHLKLFEIGCKRNAKRCAAVRPLNYNSPVPGLRTMKGCNIKKSHNLVALSGNLTNMHSTCILRFELGLELKDPSRIRLTFSEVRASRNGKEFQEEWQQ
jgi:hypothetical protein